MPEATLKHIAKLAGVAPVTVSRVVNGSDNVAATTREKVLAIIRDLEYTPNMHAANLRRKTLNDGSTSGSGDRLLCAEASLRAGCNSSLHIPCLPEGAIIFSSEEGRALAERIGRLRNDLDQLRNRTERIQRCVDIIQEACSRRLSSRAAH